MGRWDRRIGKALFGRGFTMVFTMGFTLETQIDVDKPWFPLENDQTLMQAQDSVVTSVVGNLEQS